MARLTFERVWSGDVFLLCFVSQDCCSSPDHQLLAGEWCSQCGGHESPGQTRREEEGQVFAGSCCGGVPAIAGQVRSLPCAGHPCARLACASLGGDTVFVFSFCSSTDAYMMTGTWLSCQTALDQKWRQLVPTRPQVYSPLLLAPGIPVVATKLNSLEPIVSMWKPM